MEIWLAAENKQDAQHWACICQALEDESRECWDPLEASQRGQGEPRIGLKLMGEAY